MPGAVTRTAGAVTRFTSDGVQPWWLCHERSGPATVMGICPAGGYRPRGSVRVYGADAGPCECGSPLCVIRHRRWEVFVSSTVPRVSPVSARPDTSFEDGVNTCRLGPTPCCEVSGRRDKGAVGGRENGEIAADRVNLLVTFVLQ